MTVVSWAGLAHAGRHQGIRIGPAGKPSGTWPRSVTLANGGTVTVGPLVDPRLFTMVVLVYRQSDGTLHPTTVTIAGTSAGSSLSSAQATAAGLDESKFAPSPRVRSRDCRRGAAR